MKEYIFKDYYIKDYLLKKDGIDDKKHLLHQKGSVPCIDKKLWEDVKGKIDGIAFRTKNKIIFRIKASEFDALKKEIDLGWGVQYYVERPYWNITPQELAVVK
jgi:hypothetical protein